MPQAIPGIIAWGASMLQSGIVIFGVKMSISKMLLTAAVSIASSYVASRLLKPSTPSVNDYISTQTVTFQDSVPERRIVYGEVQVGGPIASAQYHYGGAMVDVTILLAAHECNSVKELIINGETVATGNGDAQEMTVTGKYKGATVESTSWSLSDPAAIGDHFLYGPVSGNVSPGNAFKLTNALPAEANGWYRARADHHTQVSGHHIRCIRIDGKPWVPTTGSVGGTGIVLSVAYLECVPHYGTNGQLVDDYLESSEYAVDSNFRLRGICYIRLSLLFNPNIYPSGFPKVNFLVQGKKVYDPRDLSTAYSSNWALCLRDYLITSRTLGGFGAPASKVDDATVITAANISDEQVTHDSAVLNRYECHYAYNTGERPVDIIDSMRAAGAGDITWVQGVYKIYAGAYLTPTVTLNPGDRRGGLRVRPRMARRELFNAVTSLYVDGETARESGTITNAAYITEDGGQELRKTLELRAVRDRRMAQRLAKIALQRHRQGLVVDYPAKLTALQIQPMMTVYVNEPVMGWVNKVFKVLSWSLSEDLGVDLTLKEESASAYTWSTSDDVPFDDAVNSGIPDGGHIDPPTNLQIQSGEAQLLEQSDGTIKPRALLTWDEPSGIADYYIVQYMESGGKAWRSVQVDDNQAYLTDIKDGVNYDFRVQSVNPRGGRSVTYAEQSNVFIEGRTAKPPDVTTLLVNRQADGTREFKWTADTIPKDWAGYKIKYVLSTGGVWETMSDLHSGLVLASPFETNQLAEGTYTFAIKMVDTTGNESENAKYVESTIGPPRISGSLHSFNFHQDGFSGTLTNCFVDPVSGDLAPDTTDAWTDLPSTWDAWTSWNMNPVASMVFESDSVDVGVIAESVPLVTVEIASGTVTVKERHKDNAGDAWSSYATLDGSPISYRYIQFEITITTPDIAGITNAYFIATAETVEETIEDLDTSTLTGAQRVAAGHIRLPLTKSYAKIKSVQLALQNVGSGWTWEIINKAHANGPELKIYNGSGTLADATIDADIIGV